MSSAIPSTMSLLIKPAGPDCNLRCSYCFYRQKAGMFRGMKEHRMKDSILEAVISQGMEAGLDLTMFSWQGGEPTLMGLDFFRRAVQLQQANLRPGQIVTNSLQTNGTLLDRKWGEFLRDNHFLVGISLDGPASIHNHYRRDEKRVGSHARVMQNLRTMLELGVEVNILTLVNDLNGQEPDRVYDYLLETGVKHFQFIPCVEPGPHGSTAPYSVTPEVYGDFLCRLFDRWMDSPMDISIRDFDDLMAMYQGQPANTCTQQPLCGGYMVVEHNGEVYPCDFFVLPRWTLGNVHETTISELRESPKLAEFGSQKSMLSEACRECEWLGYCYGGCLKHRMKAVDLPTYYCKSHKALYKHSRAVLESLQAEQPEITDLPRAP